MKKKKRVIALLLAGCIFTNIGVSASDTYVNSQGVEMTLEEYQNFKQAYTDEEIDWMPQEKFDFFKKYDLSQGKKAEKYYKIETYNGEIISETEVTEDEIPSSYEENIMPMTTFYETAYKRVSVSTYTYSNGAIGVDLKGTWLKMPAIRSFDVIAFRCNNCTLYNNDYSGFQYYETASGSDTIFYQRYGTNTKCLDQGCGTSMNLVDDANKIQCELMFEVVRTSSVNRPFLLGTYQHATRNVTLAQSQDYTINAGGYGNVLDFSTNVEDYYDQMSGVDLYLD